jgi:hypothetical protein
MITFASSVQNKILRRRQKCDVLGVSFLCLVKIHIVGIASGPVYMKGLHDYMHN